MTVGGICLTFIGCVSEPEQVEPIREPSFPTPVAAVSPVDEPELEDLPDQAWGVPSDLADQYGKPPFGWLFWVFVGPVVMLAMIFMRYVLRIRKELKETKKDGIRRRI